MTSAIQKLIHRIREWWCGPSPTPMLDADQIERLARASATLQWVTMARQSGVPNEVIQKVIDDD